MKMRGLKLFMTAVFATLSVSLSACSSENGGNESRPEPPVPENPGTGATSAVYITRNITPEGLLAVYEAMGREASGKVAVKLSTGEPGGRSGTAAHLRAAEDSGKMHLIERIDSRRGMHTLDYAEQIGLGSRRYELIRLD